MEKDLREKVESLQIFYDSAVDREVIIKELRDENKKLKARLGDNKSGS
jgi:hypothetical protein